MIPRLPTLLCDLAATNANGVGDADLLARFVASQDATAFELLVWRHTGMVLRVCRGVLGDHHSAEDACQATFLALARQARGVGRGAVAGWLYRVARRIATRAATRAERLSARPLDLLNQAPAPNQPDGLDPTLIRLLHDEVARLPDRYRVPVLLCFFEGLTHQIAAERLGVPIGTLAARIARAKDRLRRRLSARGFGMSSGMLVVALTSGSATPMPTFVAATTQAAGLFAVGGSPGVSETVLELAKGANRTMMNAKLRWGVSVSALFGIVTLCGLWVAGSEEPPKPPATKGPAAPVSDQPFGFTYQTIDVNDLVEVHNLNIYKYKVEIPKKQRFHVVLRELENQDAAPNELMRFSFQRGDKDGPIIIRVAFTRTDGTVGGVLLTEQKEAFFRVTCQDCEPSALVTIVPVPLSGVKLNKKTLMPHGSDRDLKKSGVKETRLLWVFHNGMGTGRYPRAELLIEKDEPNRGK